MSTFDEGCGDPAPSRRDVVKYGTAALAAAAVPAPAAADLVVNPVRWRPGRAPVPMQRVRRPDPFVEEVFARNEETKKPWVKAEPSSHIFTARLPGDLDPGTHCIAVRAVDEYGREHRDHLVVEVTGGEDARGRGRRS